MGAATNILLNEHQFLGKMLDFTGELAGRMRRGERVQSEVLGKAVEFFRVCLEGCLLTKEEDILFPKLRQKGFFRQGGVLALMAIDHEKGRRLLRKMAEAAAAYEDGTGEAGNRWATAALEFVDLMRTHLSDEEASLFMLADSFLQPPEQAELADEFRRLETTRATSGRHGLIHRMPEELSEKREEGTPVSMAQPPARAPSGTA